MQDGGKGQGADRGWWLGEWGPLCVMCHVSACSLVSGTSLRFRADAGASERELLVLPAGVGPVFVFFVFVVKCSCAVCLTHGLLFSPVYAQSVGVFNSHRAPSHRQKTEDEHHDHRHREISSFSSC